MQTPVEFANEILEAMFEFLMFSYRLFMNFLIILLEEILWILNDIWPFVLLFILFFVAIKLMDSNFFGYNKILNSEIKKKEEFKDLQLLCPNCETDILESEDFCFKCGYDLNIQKEKEETLTVDEQHQEFRDTFFLKKRGQMLESMSSSSSYDEFLKKEEKQEAVEEYLRLNPTAQSNTLALMLKGLGMSKWERFKEAFWLIFPFLLIIGGYIGMMALILQ